MRTKKAMINSSANILGFLIPFIPSLIIRKLFLDSLGSDMLGLNSLYSNIIGWLSIVEMGVGTAIIFSLYKPYAENDYRKIRAYIKFYKSFYIKIGIIILVAGISIVPFLKYFMKESINSSLATIVFIILLLNTFITYLFSHNLCILIVAQEEYRITICTTISKLVISTFQLLMFKLYPSFILFVSIQLLVNIIYYISINIYITKKYEWIKSDNDKLEGKERKKLLKDVKSMFAHKIGVVIVNSTDSLVISKFVGLSVLANYTNYQTIISAIQSVVCQGLNGLTASIGNMLVTSNKEESYKVHKKIFFLNFWIVSFIAITLNNTLNQFIAIWVGKNYMLDDLTFYVLLINFYFYSLRGSVEQFQNASGNFYQDRYAAIFESIINLLVSLILVNHIGLAGVFIGTLISNLCVVFWTKPYIVYRYVFNVKLYEYYKMYFKYLSMAILPLVITRYLTREISMNYTIPFFIINCLINIISINIIYIIIFFKNNEFKYYLNLVKKILGFKRNINEENKSKCYNSSL